MNLNLPNSSISQDELNNIRNTILSNTTNITNLTNTYNTGISKIATKITQCGVSTTSNASPDTMVANIGSIFTNRYNQGINDGRQGYYTQAQYNQYGNDRYNAGVNEGRVGWYNQTQYNNYGTQKYNEGLSNAFQLTFLNHPDYNTFLSIKNRIVAATYLMNDNGNYWTFYNYITLGNPGSDVYTIPIEKVRFINLFWTSYEGRVPVSRITYSNAMNQIDIHYNNNNNQPMRDLIVIYK